MFSSVAAVSYYNPPSEAPQQQNVLQLAPETNTTRVADTSESIASSTFAISLANGPTATALTPRRLSRTAGTTYTLTIYGASLTGANRVTLAGAGNDVVVFGPLVSDDGRLLTVDLSVSPSAPFGLTSIIVAEPVGARRKFPVREGDRPRNITCVRLQADHHQQFNGASTDCVSRTLADDSRRQEQWTQRIERRMSS